MPEKCEGCSQPYKSKVTPMIIDPSHGGLEIGLYRDIFVPQPAGIR